MTNNDEHSVDNVDPSTEILSNTEKENIQLSRYDIELSGILGGGGGQVIAIPGSIVGMIPPQIQQLQHKPKDRDDLISTFDVPADSIIKLKYKDRLIPWSLVQACDCHSGQLDIQIFRPHQNIKPKLSECFPSDSLIREKVNRLESRIASLEESVDPVNMDMKTEKDLQLLTKQISFLRRRVEEADQAEWIKKSI